MGEDRELWVGRGREVERKYYFLLLFKEFLVWFDKGVYGEIKNVFDFIFMFDLLKVRFFL